MVYTERGTVEEFIIKELRGDKLSWTYVEPADMGERRGGDIEESLVVDDLKKAVERINNTIEFTDADLEFIVVSLRTIPITIDGIKKFLEILRNGLVVPIQKDNEEKVIRLFDF